MLKTMQIKETKYNLILQKHRSKHGLEIATQILTMLKSTELPKYVQSLKEDQTMSIARQTIAEKVYGRTNINFCPLCLPEKGHLIEHFNDNGLLNRRNEFISGCRHQAKLLRKFNRLHKICNKNTVYELATFV